MDFKYEHIFQNDLTILKYVGIVTKDNSKYSIIFKGYHYFANIFLLGTLNALQIINCILKTDGLKSFAEIAYIMFMTLGAQFKSTFLYLNRDKFAALIADLNIKIFQPKEDAEEVVLKKVFNKFEKIRSVLLPSCMVPVLILFTLPLFSNVMMPFACWYPININNFPAFEITYIHQIMSASYAVIMYLVPNMVMGGLLTFIGLQCDLLSYRIEKLGKVGPVTRDHWLECIQHYKLILSYVEKINRVFGTAYFGEVFTSTMALCLDLFLLSLTVRPFMFLYHILAFLGVSFVLFLPCWFASDMTIKSDLIPNAAFKCNWPDATNSFKKELLIFMACSQRPVKFYAANYFEISMVFFTTIIRSSLSYYAVMHNINMIDSE